MAKTRLYRFLSTFCDLKPGEERVTLLLFFYFFLITAPYSIIKSLRNANYLDSRGPEDLPLAYILTALLMGFIVTFHTKFQEILPRRTLIVSSLLFFIITCLLFGLFLPMEKSILPLVNWIWANIYVVVLVTQFWIVVNDIFNPREAKRLIGFFGSGGILGGIVGGEITALLARSRFSDSLLVIAAGMLIVCVFIVHSAVSPRLEAQKTGKTKSFAKGTAADLKKIGFKDSFNTVKNSPYLKVLAGIVTLTLIVSTLIDFQFNSIIKNELSGGKELTVFFGHFNAGLMIMAFFLQLLMTSNVIKRFGIRFTLLFYPAILFLCSCGIFFAPVLLMAILIKGSDKSLSYSINQSVRELLYIPIHPKVKYKAKIFIDMFLNRFAKGIGALILMFILYFQLDIRFISLVSASLILVWIIFNWRVAREYVGTISKQVELKWERAEGILHDRVDVDTTKLIFDTLASKKQSSELYAMHVFDLISQDKLTPDVKKLISYKQDEVRAASLGGLFEQGEIGLIPIEEDPWNEDALKNEIKEIMSMDIYQQFMGDYVDKVLSTEISESITKKMEVAKAIGMMPAHSPLAQKLPELLEDKSPDVLKYAISSAARLKAREYIPALVKQLNHPQTREDASTALRQYGPKIIGTLTDYLSDPDELIGIKKAIPPILAHFASQESLDFLILELEANQDEIEMELVDALEQIREENPNITFPEGQIRKKILENILLCYKRLLNTPKSSQTEQVRDSSGLFEHQSPRLTNIFKLLSLIYPHQDMMKTYQTLRTGTKDSVAYALEMLDNSLKKELTTVIFPLLEDMSDQERRKRIRYLLKSSPLFRK